MFENIGNKIKVLAYVVFWLGMIGSLILGFVMIDALPHSTKYIGWIVIIGGIFSSIVSSYMFYGFGQLINNTAKNSLTSDDSNENQENESTESEDSNDSQNTYNNAVRIDLRKDDDSEVTNEFDDNSANLSIIKVIALLLAVTIITMILVGIFTKNI